MNCEGCEIEFVDDNTFNLTAYASGKPVKLRLDLRLYPGDDAKANPVGQARDDTNMEPYLPPPVGRISFSLNPFKMLVSFTMLVIIIFYFIELINGPCSMEQG